MGPPVKVQIDGQPVFLCCAGCEEKALANPKQTLAKVAELKASERAAMGESAPSKPAAGAKPYDIVGKVTAVEATKNSITIDHEAIEGLMPAMEMPYKVDRSQVIEGIKPGDQVHGRFEVRGSDYVITELHKR
jgi:Cu/Ag efflux protein CusF